MQEDDYQQYENIINGQEPKQAIPWMAYLHYYETDDESDKGRSISVFMYRESYNDCRKVVHQTAIVSGQS